MSTRTTPTQHPARSTQHSLVACLRVPDFLVALARRDSPSLRRRAVVIGGSPEEHAQVTACSREVAEAGVTVGMTLRRALALCPKAVFLPLQEGLAATEATRITDLLCLYSPAVEAIARGHAHFDIRGLARMAGMGDEAYLRDLHEAVSSACGLPVRLAAAETVFAAHAATIVPHPPAVSVLSPQSSVLLITPGGAKEFLACLPVEVLPVDPAMHQRLRVFGLDRLGQVAALPFSAMQAQFGPPGARAWELANGHDDDRIVPRRDELRVNEEIELPAPTALAEPLVVGTRALLQRALSRPEVRGQSLRRLDWRLGLESGEQVARRCVFREPTNDPARMLFVIRGKIERLQLEAAAVSLGITLSGLCSEYGHQANLWPIGPRRQKELREAIEQLNAREGEAQIYRIVEVQPWSRIPERQLALVAYAP
jgi:nucleotidyltransferase/DNA polymerase involved in DNA repair